MALLERLRRAILPVALRAALRASKIAPGDFVELLGLCPGVLFDAKPAIP